MTWHRERVLMAVTEEKLLENIAKMDDRIAAAQVQMSDRDKTKDVALGTSKINYIVSDAAPCLRTRVRH